MRLNKEIFTQYKEYPERILQFGEGNFLRAFTDWMIDRMNKEAGYNSGVVVIQPLPGGIVHILNEQDGLYTLYLNGIREGEVVSEHSVINCITRGVNPYKDYQAYLSIGNNPELKLVLSNTTEAGIAFNEEDTLDGGCQKSFPGKLTALLYQRYKYFSGAKDKGLVFIPCELIDKNGEMLREKILMFAKHWNLEEGFATWINGANTFCNSLVDRIVPGYPKERIGAVHNQLGYEDSLVVEGEQFHLWVIEGPSWVKEIFPADRAGLEVLFVDDMTPYRTRKVRILNGAHTTLVPVAYLYGIETVREAVEDGTVGKYLTDAIFNEIIPTLDLPKEELDYFASAVLDRFKNPFIKHYLMSIALNSMSKYETRVLPSVLEYVKRTGKLPEKLVFSLAALIKFYGGEREGEKIDLQDSPEILDMYKSLWINYDESELHLKEVVTKVLGNEDIWKTDLNKIKGLNERVTYYLTQIDKKGMAKALKEVM